MKHKKRTERVYNEATGWYETREVELKGYTFTDDDRILIIREYLESGVPAEEIRNFHDISCSFLSGVNHFINFFYQPIVPLGMEHIIEFTEILSVALPNNFRCRQALVVFVIDAMKFHSSALMLQNYYFFVKYFTFVYKF